jgi:hypothetical protein
MMNSRNCDQVSLEMARLWRAFKNSHHSLMCCHLLGGTSSSHMGIATSCCTHFCPFSLHRRGSKDPFPHAILSLVPLGLSASIKPPFLLLFAPHTSTIAHHDRYTPQPVQGSIQRRIAEHSGTGSSLQTCAPAEEVGEVIDLSELVVVVDLCPQYWELGP